MRVASQHVARAHEDAGATARATAAAQGHRRRHVRTFSCFLVILASICAYTLLALRPAVRLEIKESQGFTLTSRSVHGIRRQDMTKGIWQDENIETHDKSHKSYCEVDGNDTRSNRVLRIRRVVELNDSTWEVSPFSFSTKANNSRQADDEPIHVILVIVESLRARELASKLPKTNAKIQHTQMKSAFRASYFDINRVGSNSLPNRGALLLGSHSLGRRPTTSERLGSRSLMSAASKAGFKLTISETVQRPCQHYSNTLNLLVGECEKFKKAYHEVFTEAKCTQPEKPSIACPRFPYPSSDLPTNCSGNSAHSIMISQVIENMRKAPKTLSILSFLDFHAPKLEHMSPDLDRSLHVLIQELESYFDHFYLFLKNDIFFAFAHVFLSFAHRRRASVRDKKYRSISRPKTNCIL